MAQDAGHIPESFVLVDASIAMHRQRVSMQVKSNG
jgi:hypothetical protein